MLGVHMSIFVLRRDGFPQAVWLGWGLGVSSEASESTLELTQAPRLAIDNNRIQPRTVRLLESGAGLDALV